MKTTDDQKELFVVVDENDNVIGYKTRKECHSNKNLIHRGVCVVITNNKGEILLQKRSLTKDLDPGLLTVSASGHVNKGQTYKQTVIREAYEEIGVKINPKFVSKFLYHAPEETEIDSLYTAKHNGPFNINKNEVDSVLFITKKELKKLKYQLTPYSIQCFQKLGIL